MCVPLFPASPGTAEPCTSTEQYSPNSELQGRWRDVSQIDITCEEGSAGLGLVLEVKLAGWNQCAVHSPGSSRANSERILSEY